MNELIKFCFPGDVPSKKNSRQLIKAGGRMFFVPGAVYAKWHRRMKSEMLGRLPSTQIESCGVSISIFPATKRKSDLTNKAESIMDFLVDTGVLADDNWFIVKSVNIEFGGVDRKNPRAEVTIFS